MTIRFSRIALFSSKLMGAPLVLAGLVVLAPVPVVAQIITAPNTGRDQAALTFVSPGGECSTTVVACSEMALPPLGDADIVPSDRFFDAPPLALDVIGLGYLDTAIPVLFGDEVTRAAALYNANVFVYQRELREPVEPFNRLAIDVIGHVEIRALASNAYGELRSIEERNRCDTATSFHQRIPIGIHGHAKGRNGTHPSNNHATI